jgi:alkylhydroperoxidase/carboxymuconolactone decarboxylase family protein YurZ
MSITPEALEPEFTLTTAATRLDFLSRRDNGETTLNTVRDEDDENGWASFRDTSLDTYEALELLALGEVVSRKAHDSQLIGIRAALRGGATWEQIAEALGVPPEFAWESFNEAIAERLDDEAAAAARELAGSRPSR